MVEVATGGEEGGEQLPMVLKVPHFNSDPLLVCYNSYSMLGFGDILGMVSNKLSITKIFGHKHFKHGD